MTQVKLTILSATILLSIAGAFAWAEEADPELQRGFERKVRPFLQAYCHGCHAQDRQEAELDLSVYSSTEQVTKNHAAWETVLARLEAQEMPPEEAKRQPPSGDRQAVIEWIRAFREQEARRNAGDPGPVLARRLSNAEYNYTIRDLTGVDIRPTREFPVDPANEAGFDNSGESLAMSPALLQKYLGAAREVVDHLVLKPEGFSFAPHPVVTDTDRDKYCVKRIVDFYQRQPTDFADYFFAAWLFQHRSELEKPDATLTDVAALQRVSSKYLAKVWATLNGAEDDLGPLAELRSRWRQLPVDARQSDAVRKGCEQMRDYVVRVRRLFEPKLENLEIEGSNKGSQPLVLWKNHQYAAHRRSYDRRALRVEGDEEPDNDAPPEVVLPVGEQERAQYEAALARFCDLFPDAFYISERGRDYVGKPKDQQEKGRLLSAGFHSMMGYFRDDAPLYDLILDSTQQRELDLLWQELDFITSAPLRQYTGFVWFERTDSRYLRDPEFDFARAEDKDVTSAAMIGRLAEVYLAKARRNGAGEVEAQAVEDYFRDIDRQIRWVEVARLAAEPGHLNAVLRFAARAYRRRLSPAEQERLLTFYSALRQEEGRSHEEAIQDTLASILMSPLFCYRLDLGGEGEGTRPLSDDELASRLSYFLWSSMPDQELLDRAADGTLHHPDVLLAQTKRMLSDGRIRGLAVEFGGNWLDFRRFEEHNSVDRERFPSFTDELRQAMFEEPVRFFVDVAQQDRSVLDFLYADHTFVNPVLAAHYGIPPSPGTPGEGRGEGLSQYSSDVDQTSRGPLPDPLPEYRERGPGSRSADADEGDWKRIEGASQYHRGGLLPMSVFLTKNAPGLRTSPVKRGYWVVRRLLGERIPPPPPSVPELPNDERQLGELTLRETLALHREHKSCAGCHDRFDAIGLTFEAYGPIGETRKTDLGGRAVDDSAVFPGGSQGAGFDGLERYLRDHRQAEFLDNLCRKLLSYSLGRTLLLSDEPLLRDMRAKLEANDYRFASLVNSIVTSRQFLYKRGHAAAP